MGWLDALARHAVFSASSSEAAPSTQSRSKAGRPAAGTRAGLSVVRGTELLVAHGSQIRLLSLAACKSASAAAAANEDADKGEDSKDAAVLPQYTVRLSLARDAHHPKS